MYAARITAVLILGLALATPGFGVWGVVDAVPGATVLLPFFEVGIDEGSNPQDTLPVIYNRSGTRTIHWEVYTINGARVFSGNESLSVASSWSFSMRDLIDDNASAFDRVALTDGDFYRGFMTIDVVTAATNLSPFDDDYPFANNNVLLGYAYYLRLSQGSANGLTLPTLEYTAASGVLARLEGFYGDDDGREEIDVNALTCSQAISEGGDYSDAECNAISDDTVSIRARVFQSGAINGTTRLIVFAWTTSSPTQGGPSAICDGLGNCATSYSFTRFREDGSDADEGTVRLDHVVNVIDTTSANVAPGEIIINNIEDPSGSMQVFAFAFNSASPAGNPNINWDAIFPASVLP